MRPTLLRLALTAALLVTGAGAAKALTPDDAIYLTQMGVDPEIIIAKICVDAEAWDLTPEEIVYLAEQGVSLDVINALIDPISAAEKWGFTLGEPDAYIEEGDEIYSEEGYYPEDGYAIEESGGSALVFSLGFYYGPLAVHYFSHPYFYPYMFCNGFAFSYSYWPVYYRSYYYPWACGFYPYPYYAYGVDSYYCGYSYVGYYQHTYYGTHGSTRIHQVGDVGYRSWSNEQFRQAAYRSDKPPYPEIRGGDAGRQWADGGKSGGTRDRTEDRMRDGTGGSRRGTGSSIDPMPGDRRIGEPGTLGSGGPVGDVARIDGRDGQGTRRGGEVKGIDVGSRRSIGTPRKIDLPSRMKEIQSKRSSGTERRTVALGTDKTSKSSLGRVIKGKSGSSVATKVSRSSSAKRSTSGSILKPSRSTSSKVSKPKRSSSSEVSKPARSSSSKKSSAVKSRSSSKSNKSASKPSRSSSGSRSKGRPGGKR